MEALNAENGEIPTNPELIATADPKFGQWAGDAIAHAAGKEIPKNIDASILKRNDSRNESFSSFSNVWDNASHKVLMREPNEGELLSAADAQRLLQIITDVRNSIEPFIIAAQNDQVLYFVHNDTAPNNTFFNTKMETALLLDFEHAGATHNKVLAQLTDFGNFYARCWANPEMQKEFLKSLISADLTGNREDNKNIARAVVVFGTINLAQYGMDPQHPEHAMSKMLLKHFEENLALLK
jgi:thiamine kinase-like enzyme